jgi:hypothetical protein
VFKYELSSVPSSMFDYNRLPREACKLNLVDAIWACGSDCTHEIDGEGFQSFLVLQGIVGVKFMFGKTIPFVRRKCVTSLIDGSSG